MSRRHVGLLSGAGLLLALAVALVTVRGPGDGRAGPVDIVEPAPGPSATAASETLDEQLARVARIVKDVRGLTAAGSAEVTILEPGDLVSRVAEDLIAYTDDDADIDRRILEALRAIPANYDLRSELVTSLSQQVAGFYDPDTGELVVGAADPTERVGRLEELTLAHELQHAFADEVHGLPALDDETLGDDALFAGRALVEGDATATMQAYAEAGFSVVDRMMIAEEAMALQDQLDSMTALPHALQRSLSFPYDEGLAFVTALRARGGWGEVDAAYADPPSTTAQILFPDRYLAREAAVTVAASADPGDGWTRTHTADLGAADLLFLFEAPGDDPTVALPDPLGSAAAWQGGRVDLWTDGASSAVALAVATDRPEQMCRDLRAWLTASRPEAEVREADGVTSLVDTDEVATLRCGGTARVGIAPTARAADRLSRAG